MCERVELNIRQLNVFMVEGKSWFKEAKAVQWVLRSWKTRRNACQAHPPAGCIGSVKAHLWLVRQECKSDAKLKLRTSRILPLHSLAGWTTPKSTCEHGDASLGAATADPSRLIAVPSGIMEAHQET